MSMITAESFDSFNSLHAQGFSDGSIILETREKTVSLFAHEGIVSGLSFSVFKTCPIFLSIGNDGNAFIWKMNHGTFSIDHTIHFDSFCVSCAFSQFGKSFAIGLDNGQVHVFSMTNYEEVQLIDEFNGSVYVDFQGDDMIVGQANGSITTFLFGEAPRTQTISNNPIISLASNRAMIAVICSDMSIKIVDDGSISELPYHRSEKPALLHWKPGTNTLVVTSQNKQQTEWQKSLNGRWCQASTW